MKLKFPLILAMALTACSMSSKLANDLPGEWSGTPMHFDHEARVDGTFTPVFTFTEGGKVTLKAATSLTMPVNAPIDREGTTAVSATATGFFTVDGTWKADDRDEIKLRFNMRNLRLVMNPEVNYQLATMWTDTDTPTLRTAPENVMKAFERETLKAVTITLRELDDIDDIRISNGQMTCEFIDTHTTLSRIFKD